MASLTPRLDFQHEKAGPDDGGKPSSSSLFSYHSFTSKLPTFAKILFLKPLQLGRLQNLSVVLVAKHPASDLFQVGPFGVEFDPTTALAPIG